MSSKLAVILSGLAAIALVVVVVALLYPSGGMPSEQVALADRSVEIFADRCTLNLIDRGALEMEHTKDQLYSACTCLGEDFRVDLAGKTAEEISDFLNAAPTNLRMRNSATKCFQSAGMNFDAE